MTENLPEIVWELVWVIEMVLPVVRSGFMI